MPFRDWQATEARLRDPARLTAQEVRDLFPYMNELSVAAERRLSAELALQNIEAVQKFETSSGKLTAWLIVLTVVLLTAVITVFTLVLARPQSHLR